MEEQKDMTGFLNMVMNPVFCVKENKIISVNQSAQQLFLTVGMDIQPMLLTGAEEYADFSEGILFLTLNLVGQPCSASVQKTEGMDVFSLDIEAENIPLRALALASTGLRKPLAAAMSNTSSLLSKKWDSDDQHLLSELNQSLYQILRVLGNMSDAGRNIYSPEITDAGSFLWEVFEKAQALVKHSGITLRYENIKESVYCLMDRHQLERAVLNSISNAVKFMPNGGTIDATLTRRGHTLRLCIQDSGSGIADEVRSSLFYRYLRQPGIEDYRFGLGLGVKLIQAAAVSHGGTVLFSQNKSKGTCITITLAICQGESTLRSPVFKVDYTGGYDHALVELSDCLPSALYDGTT